MKKVGFILWALTLATANAANYPCSKGKGGVSHCMGSYFVCNDGSISQSKKICSAGDYATPEKPSKGTTKPSR
ncbi:hypothetical protein [Polaromonas sp.]|uniref:hypothetical protein n=1 Tax=Polaromonas sp. TaxID=1869339 RepID=UPI00286C9C56|nr:hypothetical protein [Polaromonas sp.]